MRDEAFSLDEMDGWIGQALLEDLDEDGDITSELLVSPHLKASGQIIAKEALVVCGMSLAHRTFELLEDLISFKIYQPDGTKVEAGTVLAKLHGPAQGILAGERTALNILQHLSGIATLTRQYVDLLEGTKAKLLDTRKTIPGTRIFAKYATRIGGAQNHRIGLYDGVFVKDNHLALSQGDLSAAIKNIKSNNINKFIIECDSIDQFKIALDLGAPHILLDNMSLAQLSEAVAINQGKSKLEASGSVSLKNIREIAGTGVDYISVGKITHSAPSVDISLDIIGH